MDVSQKIKLQNIYIRRKTMCGTLDYLPPEMIRREVYNVSVDHWCIGVLLYELLVGKPPFESEGRNETYARILSLDIIVYPEYVPEGAKDLISKELFTSKFKDRIVSMSLDKEMDVAVHAVRLVIAILKMHPAVLTDKDCENVYELVYSSWCGVAAAAGEFLNVRLFRAESAPATPARSLRGKACLPNTPLVRDLVQFFIESELLEHGAYLVDSLIESNPMMKDWECMTDLLLEEAGPGEEALDNRQESSLIELMVCCVRQASTGEPPVGRAARKHTQLSKEQAKLVSDDRARLTAHFIVTLPALLDKFGADPEKLANLVSIPQYFNLELYTTQRQEGNLTLLLKKIREIEKVRTEAVTLGTGDDPPLRLLQIRDKAVAVLEWNGGSPFVQADSLLLRLGEMAAGAKPKIISVDAMRLDTGKANVADYHGCVRASNLHGLIVYEDLSFLRATHHPFFPTVMPTVATPSGSERLQSKIDTQKTLATSNNYNNKKKGKTHDTRAMTLAATLLKTVTPKNKTSPPQASPLSPNQPSQQEKAIKAFLGTHQ